MFSSSNTGASGGLLAGQIYHQLDELVKNLGISSPALILEQLEQQLNKFFPAGVPFAGGISCGVCLYNNSDRTITFSGAKLDLFEVENSNLTRYKGLADPLLHDALVKQYDNAVISIERGSNFYLCPETYWLQQGGHEFRTLGRESFEKTILSMARQSPEEQQQILNKVFEEWRGGNEQYGDVLVFGFML